MKIEVFRDGQFQQLNPEDLTTGELCEVLSGIQIDSDEFVSQQSINEGYAAIDEAVRRLQATK